MASENINSGLKEKDSPLAIFLMSVREKDDPALYAKIEEQDLLRQYDLLANCIEIGLKKGVEFFDKYTLWALNYAAVSNTPSLAVDTAKNRS